MLNEAAVLAPMLAAVRQNFPAAELLVADGGSSDESVAAALRGADGVLLGAPGRARQMNLAAAAAKGEWLCFLHADTQPQFTEQELLSVINGPVDWGFCRVRLRGRPRALAVVSGAMNLRSRITRVATGDQMLFLRRAVFVECGGFANIPLMEDVEICKRLRRRYRPSAGTLLVESSGRRWEKQGVLPTILRMWALRLAYWLGVSPARLWHHYYGRAALAPKTRSCHE